MKTDLLQLNSFQREFARKHLSLLSREAASERRIINLRVSGYNEVMHLISDIVKVSILALSAENTVGLQNIPEPNANIGGVLSLIFDLLPYDEAALLDLLHTKILEPWNDPENERIDWEEDNIWLLPPTGLCA
jgi:hypothetical protein